MLEGQQVWVCNFCDDGLDTFTEIETHIKNIND